MIRMEKAVNLWVMAHLKQHNYGPNQPLIGQLYPYYTLRTYLKRRTVENSIFITLKYVIRFYYIKTKFVKKDVSHPCKTFNPNK